MARPAIRFSPELVRRMAEHEEIPWHEVLTAAVQRKLAEVEVLDRITAKSKMTEADAERIGHAVKAGMRRRLEQTDRAWQ